MLRCKLLIVAVCGTLCSQAGCITISELMGRKPSSPYDTTLLEAQGYSIPPGGMPSPISPNAGSGPRVVLEVRGGERHLESIPLPTDRGLFIEDLVQQAKLHEKLGHLNISIMRPNGAGAPPVRLTTRTNGDGKSVNPGENYALLPGDHLVVISDQRSGLEKFLEKQFGT